MSDDGLTLKDYLETATEASRRTRSITIVMVVISVLVGVSVLNSADFGWITLRLSKLRDRTSSYTVRKFPLLCSCDNQVQSKQSQLCQDQRTDSSSLFLWIDELDTRITQLNSELAEPNVLLVTRNQYEEKKKSLDDMQRRRSAICDEELKRLASFSEIMQRSAAETKYTVRVPFFGVAFDVDDIGILGGFSLWIVLILLRLALRSQIVSLRIGFKRAADRNEEENFYQVLATRQVFVFPRLRDPHQEQEPVRGWIEQWWRQSWIGKIYRDIQTPLADQAAGIHRVISTYLRLKELPTEKFKKAKTRLKKMRRRTQRETRDDSNKWKANRNVGLRSVPKLLSLLPFIIYGVQFGFDVSTSQYGAELAPVRTQFQLLVGAFFLLNLFGFGIWCATKWNELDRLWDYYDRRIQKKKPKDNSYLQQDPAK